jgi:hypothetical protein
MSGGIQHAWREEKCIQKFLSEKSQIKRQLLTDVNIRITEVQYHACNKLPNLWSRVILEKLIITQLVKKLLAFYGTRRFITVFKRARHWSLS